MRKLISLLGSLTIMTSAASSIVSCGTDSSSYVDKISPKMDSSDCQQIVLAGLNNYSWDIKLFSGVEFNGMNLSSDSYYVHNDLGQYKLDLNVKVYSNSKINILYDKHKYNVNTSAAPAQKLTDDEKAIIQNVDKVVKNGLTFGANYSASDIRMDVTNVSASQGKIGLNDYIKKNYFPQSLKNSNDYQVVAYSGDGKAFTPISFDKNTRDWKYTTGSYKFVIIKQSDKSIIGSAPYNLSFSIQDKTTSDRKNDIATYITGSNEFNASMGSLSFDSIYSILKQMIPNMNPMIAPAFDVVKIFGQSISAVLTNQKVIDYLKETFGDWNYFDVNSILGSSIIKKDEKGNQYYKIDDKYDKLITMICNLLTLDADKVTNQNIHKQIKGEISQFNVDYDATIDFNYGYAIRPIVESLLPDILHFLNFVKENYLSGNHNVPLLLFQYLLDNTTQKTTISNEVNYENDGFNSINHFYKSGQLEQIVASEDVEKVDDHTHHQAKLNINLENLLYDAISLKTGTLYTTWSIADSNETNGAKYCYLYSYDGIQQMVNSPALQLHFKADIKLSAGIIKEEITPDANSYNYDKSLQWTSTFGHITLYSVRFYLFCCMLEPVFNEQTKLKDSSNTFEFLNQIFGDFSLDRLNMYNLVLPDNNMIVDVDLSVMGYGYKTSVVPFNLGVFFNKEQSISRKASDKFATTIFKDYLSQIVDEKGVKVFSNDFLNSIKPSDDFKGKVILQYKEGDEWKRLDSKSTYKLFDHNIVKDLRISIQNFAMKSKYNLSGYDDLNFEGKTMNLDFDINI